GRHDRPAPRSAARPRAAHLLSGHGPERARAPRSGNGRGDCRVGHGRRGRAPGIDGMTVAPVSQTKATVIAVTSGKGGVGKTNVVVNVAVALAGLGHRVGVLDADFSLGNVDVLLGLTPERHVGHLLAGEHTLQEITRAGPNGVQIVPASSGLQSLSALTSGQRATLTQALDELRASLDFLFIDTASGVSDN